MYTPIHTIVLVFVLLLGGPADPNANIDPERSSPEVLDLSMSIGEQRYAFKVVINEAAEKGGAAILFLHGYGECGVDGERQLRVGLPKHAQENPEDWPFVLLVPQKPVYNSEWADHEQALLKLLEKSEEMGLHDPDRLAITGLSQGGHGTALIASRHPEMFVAAAPVCGYIRPVFDEERGRIDHPPATVEAAEFVQAAENLHDVPVWLFHGDADQVVPVKESQVFYEALKAAGADARYTELEGVNHNAWDDAYTDDELIAWFKEHLLEN